MERVVVIALVLLSACGREPVVVVPPRPLDVPPIDAGAPASPAPHGHAKGDVTVSFLMPDGGYWASYPVTPDPADVVKPCYAQTLASDPSVSGWAMFEISPSMGSSTVVLAESSPLPAPLVACLTSALRRLGVFGSGFSSLPTSLAYVSLR